MVKFLHTADWHLGKTLKNVGDHEKADKLREARFEALRNLLSKAESNNVDFVVAAGDLFDSNQLKEEHLEQAKNCLNDFTGLPIYVIPGTRGHDPMMDDYAFHRAPFERLNDHVQILEKEEPVDVPETDAVLYPGIATRPESADNPIEWIPDLEDKDEISIGIAHGSWQIMPDLPRDDYPVPKDFAERSHLDYLALGHWHGLYPDPDDGDRTYYSGTHEPTGYDENSGYALFITIEEETARPELDTIEVNEYSWVELNHSVSDQVSIDDLKSDIDDLVSDPERTLLKLNVTGTVSLEVNNSLSELFDRLNDDLFEVQIDRTELNLVPSDEEIQELSTGEGWLEDAVDKLELLSTDEASPPESWNMDEPPTQEEAQRALEILYGQMAGQ